MTVAFQGSDESTAPPLVAAARMGVPVLDLRPDRFTAGMLELSLRAGPRQSAVQRTVGRQDTCLVLHTSGTTAKPKIVPLTHENIVVGVSCVASTLKLQR